MWSRSNVAPSSQNDLTLTLRAIFDYFSLVLQALGGESKKDKKEVVKPHDLRLPDAGHWEHLYRSTARALAAQKDGELADFFNFYYGLDKENGEQDAVSFSQLPPAVIRLATF